MAAVAQSLRPRLLGGGGRGDDRFLSSDAGGTAFDLLGFKGCGHELAFLGNSGLVLKFFNVMPKHVRGRVILGDLQLELSRSLALRRRGCGHANTNEKKMKTKHSDTQKPNKRTFLDLEEASALALQFLLGGFFDTDGGARL